ncbi:hypothetical protein B5X24_HaOG213379 [Helicoverpa armigera]|uniref:Uncharacterized protein n=1 Tax=Helicoverpa armigera TaxID=29058 RepID=A0A2W1B7E4_HELAM|nr:hypothetical protein B5X24_HaOG213379 [Helicoverpa armigera]
MSALVQSPGINIWRQVTGHLRHAVRSYLKPVQGGYDDFTFCRKKKNSERCLKSGATPLRAAPKKMHNDALTPSL